MIRHKIVLEVKKGERDYQMECYNESPLGEVFDVLTEMRAYVLERMKQAEEKPKEG